jgi:hypothetical protein
MKKAQLSTQFNWIFVFIVGAIILIFFLYLIRAQTKSADKELTGDILKNLETVVKSSESTAGVVKVINIPSSNINFFCQEDISYYEIGSLRRDIPYDIIFSEDKLMGDKIVSWTQSWNVPFRISVFQYVSTDNIYFLVVQDDHGLADELFNLLPANISKNKISQTDLIKDLNFDHYKIIQFKDSEFTGTIEPVQGVDSLIINAPYGLNAYGQIEFVNEGVSVGFLKKESLLGAIYSADSNYYNCTMNKAFNRLELLLNLNKKRLAELETFVSDTDCNTTYSFSYDDMDEMINHMNIQEVENLHILSERIARDNQKLIRGRNCPLIY